MQPFTPQSGGQLSQEQGKKEPGAKAMSEVEKLQWTSEQRKVGKPVRERGRRRGTTENK